MFILNRILLAVIGQSNHVGNGIVLARTGALGYPTIDPIGPAGYARSLWPTLVELLGSRGVMARVWNAGRGSTSIVRHWCGYIRAWQNSSVYQGMFILANGGLWKANTPAGSYITTVTAPSGTSNVTIDTIPWVYVGVPAAHEVDGYISKPGDRTWDPNGYIATALAASSWGSEPERWLSISFGEQDSLTGWHASTRAMYRQAHITLTDYALSLGYRVSLGFTNYAGAGRETSYTDELMPGLADAIANYAGNRNVIAGANLRTALGVLAVDGAGVNSLNKATQNDGLHMNDYTLTLAAKANFDAYVSAGWA